MTSIKTVCPVFKVVGVHLIFPNLWLKQV